MAAITNGIALDGTLRPYGGTFLIFSDYMRPSLRLAALMRLPSLFVFTHDSILLGEDGPTHQPIEQLDALRAIPTAYRDPPGRRGGGGRWRGRGSRGRRRGPVALALTRQTVPALKREARALGRRRGARRVRAARPREPGGRARGLGSEVSLACEAAALLSRGERRGARGLAAEPRAASPRSRRAYRDELLRPGGRPWSRSRPGRGESLRGLVGREGLVYGIDRFGASAPYKKLAEFFGFTADRARARARAPRPRGEGCTESERVRGHSLDWGGDWNVDR